MLSKKLGNRSSFMIWNIIVHEYEIPAPEKRLLLAHSFSWGSRHFSSIVLYWSWFILPLIICRRPVPKTLITLHTVTWMACLHADAYEHRAQLYRKLSLFVYGDWWVSNEHTPRYTNAEKKIGPFLGCSIRPNLVLIRPWAGRRVPGHVWCSCYWAWQQPYVKSRLLLSRQTNILYSPWTELLMDCQLSRLLMAESLKFWVLDSHSQTLSCLVLKILDATINGICVIVSLYNASLRGIGRWTGVT